MQNPLKMARFLPLLLTGCMATREIPVGYPLESSVVQRINRGGTIATVERSDSTVLSVSSLRVDSLKAVWLSDEWTITPLVDIRSITVPDPDDEENLKLKGILYSAAGFGLIGLVDALVAGRSGVVGETIGGAAAGGLLAAYVLPQTSWRQLKFTLSPPKDETDRIRREADRLRLWQEIPGAQAELQREERRYRIEPAIMIGRGNSLHPESDPTSLYALGGKMSFGYAVWERGELAFEFTLMSHTFRRTDSREQAVRSAFLFTGTYFPFSRSSFFVQGGAGYGFYSATATYTGAARTNPPVTPPLVSGSGLAAVAGAGFDFPLSDHWRLRPAVRYTFLSIGDLDLNDSALLATGRSSHLFAFSLSLVFQGI